MSCSPLLRVLFESMGMEQSIFYDRAYFTVYLPSFNVLSVKALLQFLYTGEVGKLRLVFNYICVIFHTRVLTCFTFVSTNIIWINIFLNSELTSGSTTTSEFSELCKALKINPPVNKYRKYTSKKTNPTKTATGNHRVYDTYEIINVK